MIQIPKILPELDLDTKLSLSIVSSFAIALLTYMSIFGFAGRFGDVVAEYLGVFLGKGVGFLPIVFLFLGIMLFRIQKKVELTEDVNARLVWGIIIGFIVFSATLNIIFGVDSPSNMIEGGGLVGYMIYPLVLGYFGYGAIVILGVMAFLSFFLISQMTFTQFVDNFGAFVREPAKFWDFIPDIFEIWKQNQKVTNKDTAQTTPQYEDQGVAESISAQQHEPSQEPMSPVEEVKKAAKGLKKRFTVTDAKDGVIDLQIDDRASSEDWQTPPFELLKKGKASSNPGDTERNKKIIQDTLAHFGITVEMKEVQVGPTVSQYTFKPANGVKLSAIDNLQRDLGLALATANIRVEAPIQGKSLVGIEIPNPQKAEVSLRQLVETKEFVNSRNDLLLAIGKDVSGVNLTFPLAKMPHLLVAGSTGSGKSVWINGMLLSLMLRYSPLDLQVILVDMKRVELKLYEHVPHLLCPVITEAEKAINALKWSVIEMDRRYKLLEQHGKRNLADYNAFARSNKMDTMAFMVVVIDELGDLMMIAKSEVEPIIVRLTQMSRAVGIHLVLGTQRPDTHVVTGLIKANIPSRIAFAVASQIDSRVILDQSGAEKLLGMGDGLFMNPTSLTPVRFQGPNVTEKEVRAFVTYLKEEGQRHEYNNIDVGVTEPPKTKVNVPGMVSNSSSDSGNDEYVEEARRLVIAHQKASASFLQQMMGIGYPKAARIIQQLEDMNVVGPQNGSKPREVYELPEEE
jgi:S-DNA-T family DNA segregation ATPase FtsK/SpoIIIE